MPEKVLVMLKPDAIKRGLAGRIVSTINSKSGLKMANYKLITPGKKKIEGWYEQKDRLSQRTYPPKELIVKYLSRGPLILTVWEGESALEKIREVIGQGTDPSRCKAGTIRRDFGADTVENASRENRAVENLVHASRSAESAQRELEFWFGKS